MGYGLGSDSTVVGSTWGGDIYFPPVVLNMIKPPREILTISRAMHMAVTTHEYPKTCRGVMEEPNARTEPVMSSCCVSQG